jgi:catechol 2,3-dioxygenase-like lactoylglutathione lyase family enzyme
MTTTLLSSIQIATVMVLDQDEALDFYCGKLGFEVRDDADLGFMRWLTIGLPGQDDPQLLLSLPGGPAQDADTAAQVRDLLTKGALGGVFLTSDDVRAAYTALRDAGVEITQEPVEQPYGIDIGIRDPFGNQVRISQLNGASTADIERAYREQATTDT